MKISGPKGPGPIAPPPDEPARPAKAGAGAFREVLAPAASQPQGLAAAVSPAWAEIQARLKAGEITGAQAAEQLVDAVVRSQLSEAAPRLQAELRAALTRLLTEDPILSAKLHALQEDHE